MFDGISLTEQQRQQLRDLMQRARHDRQPINVSEMETMHRLVTAENFDENAVRAQANKMAQEQVTRQIEMAKVRNQMYHLLTPEQQAVLNAKHQQRMDQLREVARMQKVQQPCCRVVAIPCNPSSRPCFPCHRHHPCLPHMMFLPVIQRNDSRLAPRGDKSSGYTKRIAEKEHV